MKPNLGFASKSQISNFNWHYFISKKIKHKYNFGGIQISHISQYCLGPLATTSWPISCPTLQKYMNSKKKKKRINFKKSPSTVSFLDLHLHVYIFLFYFNFLNFLSSFPSFFCKRGNREGEGREENAEDALLQPPTYPIEILSSPIS